MQAPKKLRPRIPSVPQLALSAALSAMIWLSFPNPASAAEYWEYSYGGVDVIDSRRGESAKSIAHSLLRLKSAIEVVMGAAPTGWQPPTAVYSVPTETLQRLRGSKDDVGSVFSSTTYDDTILMDNAGYSVDTLFNAYFGYASSVLLNEYSRNYQPWFIQGMAELFGASSMNAFNVTVGVARTRRLQALFHSKLIPIKTLLNLRDEDPQLKSEDFFDLYSAESWLLVHQIIVEGKYKSNFFHYFELRDQGEDSDKAFADSFDISPADLDKLLQVTIQQGKVYLLRIDIKALDDSTPAKRLSTAEAAGRLSAFAALRSPHIDVAQQMTSEALTLDAKNSDALWAQAYIQVRRADYDAALQATNILCTSEPPPLKIASRCGTLLYDLLEQKKTGTDIERKALAERSHLFYDRAVRLDPGDLRAWDSEANVLSILDDADLTRAFLSRAVPVLSSHPGVNDLARVLARLAASTGDTATAITLATMWKKAAADEDTRERASAYLSRLKATLDHTSPPGTTVSR